MISSVADDLRNLELLIGERIVSGSEELSYHSGSKTVMLGWLLDTSAFISLVEGYVGSVLFFLISGMRKMGAVHNKYFQVDAVHDGANPGR